MTTLTIAVPDELAEEVGAWEDGESYNLTVTQTGTGKFDLVSGELAEAEPEEESEYEGGSDGEEKGGMMKKKIPAAIAVLIGKAK